AEDGIRDDLVTGVQTCALPISAAFQKCHQGDRQRGSPALRRRELHDAHRSAYRSTVNSPANKELAAAATEREEKRRNHENRQERSEEHTSELQSPDHLVCRLLL